MCSVITLKIQTQNTNKSSAGECADVRCRGFVVGGLLIFLSKAVLHFDYLVFLKAIQVGLFCLGLFCWDYGFSENGPGLLFTSISSFQGGGKPCLCSSDTRSSWKDKNVCQGIDLKSTLG